LGTFADPEEEAVSDACGDALPPKPVVLAGDLRNLPAALASLAKEPRWVVWRWTFIAQRKKWTKVPYQPDRPHQKARSNDPATWGEYGAAIAVVEREEADGIGYQLAGGEIAAFDLDDCRDPASGEIASWAWTLVDEAQSYAEVTVSGTGLRIIGWARGDHVHRKCAVGDGVGSLEIYRKAKRFIVVTGVRVEGAYDRLAEIDPAIDAAAARYLAAKDTSAAARSDALDFNNALRSPDGDEETELPPALLDLIRRGVPEGGRSEQFHHAVGWLKDLGWGAQRILALLEQNPGGIAAKYHGRLGAEVERCFGKTGQSGGTGQDAPGRALPGASPLPLHWHGDPDDDGERKWLVAETIPETGKGLLSGQWGTGKTFVALDLAGAVMTGTTFAGRSVMRTGGVLFIAAEGANEVSIRLRGVVQSKLREEASIDPGKLERLPFAWINECPPLTSRDALPILRATIVAAAEQMRAQFDLPAVLIVIDTLMAAADFEDENDSAQGQKVMRVLEDLSRTSGAFVVAADHFGKAVETGTRGTSAKEASADVVLALLGEKDIGGNVRNRRMALRKLRGGATGAETPFELRQVSLEAQTAFGATTTCVVEWGTEGSAVAVAKPLSDSTKHFMSSLREALLEHGSKRNPFGSAGRTITVVEGDRVRDEFVASYPADADDNEQRANTKRAAYRRALKAAKEAGLFCSREIARVDYYWLAEGDETNHPQRGT
jgi:hypothetical protein